MNTPIVDSARSWLGTRFHHQGRLKKTATHKGGVDCLGLLIGVARELNLPFTDYDETDYPHYPDTEKLRKKLSTILQEIPKEAIKAGDILLFSIDGNPQHLAIVAGNRNEGFSIIHAYAPAKAVVEHTLDEWWQGKIAAAFRMPIQQ